MVFFLVYEVNFLVSQDIDNQLIQKQRNDIDFTNLLIESTDSNSLSIEKLQLINAKIERRNLLINTLDQQVKDINKNINQNSDSIKYLEEFLYKLIDEYETMIYFAFKNKGSFNELMFILSANNFNQAYKRYIYLKQYYNHRKSQVILIKRTRVELDSKIKLLELDRVAKKDLLKVKRRENDYLDEEIIQKSSIVAVLERKKDEILKEMNKQLDVISKLNQNISDIVEMRNEYMQELDKKWLRKVNDDFQSFQGKLPWPVDQGVILSYFGEHEHPVFNGLKVVNNGIDISTLEGSFAKAVHEGIISKIVSIPGANKAILINHGDYFTVYSNLENIVVKVGDKVNKGDQLGKIFTNMSENHITLLQFQIWHKSSKLNPVYWLKNT